MGRVLHASYSGWFPFCLKNQNTGAIIPPDPLWYPPPVSLETAMRWYWRVKKWKIEVSHIVLIDGVEEIFTDTQYVEHPNIGFDYLGGPAQITQEEKYVCGMSGLGIIGYNPDFDPGSEEDAFGCRIWFQSYPGNFNDYWGIFRLPDTEDNRPIKEYDFYMALNFVFGEIGGVDLSSGSYQIEINYPDSPDKIQMTFSQNDFVKIYPEEYWSYGGVYNTQTGQPL